MEGWFCNPALIDTLTKDFELYKNNKLYNDYLNQFFKSHTKGEPLMVCEGLLNYFGTSSKELLEQGTQQAQKLYQDQIEKLIAEINTLTSENNKLSSENSILTSQLEEITKRLPPNNIAY